MHISFRSLRASLLALGVGVGAAWGADPTTVTTWADDVIDQPDSFRPAGEAIFRIGNNHPAGDYEVASTQALIHPLTPGGVPSSELKNMVWQDAVPVAFTYVYAPASGTATLSFTPSGGSLQTIVTPIDFNHTLNPSSGCAPRSLLIRVRSANPRHVVTFGNLHIYGADGVTLLPDDPSNPIQGTTLSSSASDIGAMTMEVSNAGIKDGATVTGTIAMDYDGTAPTSSSSMNATIKPAEEESDPCCKCPEGDGPECGNKDGGQTDSGSKAGTGSNDPPVTDLRSEGFKAGR